MMDLGILFFVIIMAVMLLFAVLSNGLVIYCVIKIKKLRTITNVFICNLSVSDILLAGFIMPQKLHDISHKEDFFEGMFLSFTLRKHAHVLYCEENNFEMRNCDVFHNFARNIDCGDTLESPRRGGSNEYPQSMC